MKDCLPEGPLVERGLVKAAAEERDAWEIGEKRQNFAFVPLKASNREKQIRQLREAYPPTDGNSVSMIIDESGNILHTFDRFTTKKDFEKEEEEDKNKDKVNIS